MKEIYVVGSINQDMILQVDQMGQVGQSIKAKQLRYLPGGKGANQALAAHKLGGRVHLIGAVGQDAFGKGLTEHLSGQGMDVSGLVQLEEVPTGLATIIQHQQDNTIYVLGGANLALGPDQVTWPSFHSHQILLVQNEVSPSLTLHALKLAKTGGALTMVNPSPFEATLLDCLAFTDYLVTNEGEAKALLELWGRGDLAWEAAFAYCLGLYPDMNWIITLGSEGLLYYTSQGLVHVPAYPVAALDTTGAGDCFLGALANALARDWPLDQALDWAQEAAALSTMAIGAQTAYPSYQEMGQLRKERK